MEEHGNTGKSTIRIAGLTSQDDMFLGEDPELVQLVVTKIENMDKDGDGRVNRSELALGMMDAVKAAVKAKKKTRNLKYVITALGGLLCMMAATGLVTSYAAVKLAQEIKVTSDGTLVKADGVSPVRTTPQGVIIPLSLPATVPASRRGLEEVIPNCDDLAADASNETLCDEIMGCISEEQKDILHENSFVAPVVLVFPSGTESSIQSQTWSEDPEGLDTINITTTDGEDISIEDDESCDTVERRVLHEAGQKGGWPRRGLLNCVVDGKSRTGGKWCKTHKKMKRKMKKKRWIERQLKKERLAEYANA